MAKRKAKKAKTKPAPSKKAAKKKSKASPPAAKVKKKSKVANAGGKKAKTAKPAAKKTVTKKKVKPAAAKAPAKKVKTKPGSKAPTSKTPKPAAKAAAPKPAGKTGKGSIARSSPAKGSPKLMIPPPLLNSDYLPLWFGGDGLSDCFKTMGVATIGELREKTEADVQEAGGTSALVRIKARIERIEERALAPKLEPPALGAAPPMSEIFAYFLKPSAAEHSLGANAGRSQICDIVHRPSSTQVTVRLCGPVAGGWRDVTVPLDQLELISRDHRREELEDSAKDEVDELLSIYRLKEIDPVTRVDAILDYEFSTFGREW